MNWYNHIKLAQLDPEWEQNRPPQAPDIGSEELYGYWVSPQGEIIPVECANPMSNCHNRVIQKRTGLDQFQAQAQGWVRIVTDMSNCGIESLAPPTEGQIAAITSVMKNAPACNEVFVDFPSLHTNVRLKFLANALRKAQNSKVLSWSLLERK